MRISTALGNDAISAVVVAKISFCCLVADTSLVVADLAVQNTPAHAINAVFTLATKASELVGHIG